MLLKLLNLAKYFIYGRKLDLPTLICYTRVEWRVFRKIFSTLWDSTEYVIVIVIVIRILICYLVVSRHCLCMGVRIHDSYFQVIIHTLTLEILKIEANAWDIVDHCLRLCISVWSFKVSRRKGGGVLSSSLMLLWILTKWKYYGFNWHLHNCKEESCRDLSKTPSLLH